MIVYQLKIVLYDIKPPIWRRVLVPGEMSLPELHRAIQAAMPWEDYHLWAFSSVDRSSRFRYTLPVEEEFWSFPTFDSEAAFLESLPDDLRERAADLPRDFNAEKFTVADILPAPRSTIRYEYDFGDSWYHHLLLEKMVDVPDATPLPVCLTGKRACPPEDCGGAYSYSAFVEALTDPVVAAEFEDFAEVKKWFGDDFDPASFDLDATNERLRAAFPR